MFYPLLHNTFTSTSTGHYTSHTKPTHKPNWSNSTLNKSLMPGFPAQLQFHLCLDTKRMSVFSDNFVFNSFRALNYGPWHVRDRLLKYVTIWDKWIVFHCSLTQIREGNSLGKHVFLLFLYIFLYDIDDVLEWQAHLHISLASNLKWLNI